MTSLDISTVHTVHRTRTRHISIHRTSLRHIYITVKRTSPRHIYIQTCTSMTSPRYVVCLAASLDPDPERSGTFSRILIWIDDYLFRILALKDKLMFSIYTGINGSTRLISGQGAG